MRKLLFLFATLFTFILNAQDIRYTTTNLNLRSQPNTASTIITVIPRGITVNIEDDCNCKWIPISYNGHIGYVSSKYLTKKKTNDFDNPRKGIRHYTNSRGNRIQSPTYYNSVPTGATALCRDGTYSFSQSRRGTCSHHGGVAKWLK